MIVTAKNENKPVCKINESQYSKSIIHEYASKKVVTVTSKVESNSELQEYKKIQKNEIDGFINSKSLSNTKKDLLKNAVTSITFTEVISLEDLNIILQDSKSNLIDCEIKYINNNNEWITACIKSYASSKDAIDMIQKATVDSGKESSLTYKGITSARIKMNLYNQSYKVMSSHPKVFLVDISDTLIRLANSDYNGELKVRVPDLSWSVDSIK